jgi:hypothetical protein
MSAPEPETDQVAAFEPSEDFKQRFGHWTYSTKRDHDEGTYVDRVPPADEKADRAIKIHTMCGCAGGIVDKAPNDLGRIPDANGRLLYDSELAHTCMCFKAPTVVDNARMVHLYELGAPRRMLALNNAFAQPYVGPEYVSGAEAEAKAKACSDEP